jgi:hypothetical protein
MPYNWGPHYIVPTEALEIYSGQVLLREDYDDDLLLKELEELGLTGSIVRVTNPWYFRKKGTQTWIKLGESSDRVKNFPVRWDTSDLPDGQYEILGMMHVSVISGNVEYTIASHNITEVKVKNPPKHVLNWRKYPNDNN